MRRWTEWWPVGAAGLSWIAAAWVLRSSGCESLFGDRKESMGWPEAVGVGLLATLALVLALVPSIEPKSRMVLRLGVPLAVAVLAGTIAVLAHRHGIPLVASPVVGLATIGIVAVVIGLGLLLLSVS